MNGSNYRCANTGPNSHDKISIVEVPKANPAAAKVVNAPVLFPDGGNPGEPGGTQRATTGCHDITVYQKIGLAAGACTGEGAIIDINDPVNPKVMPPSRIRTSPSGTAPRSARTASGSCSPTSSAAAVSRRATRRWARTAAPTRSTTSRIPRIRSS